MLNSPIFNDISEGINIGNDSQISSNGSVTSYAFNYLLIYNFNAILENPTVSYLLASKIPKFKTDISSIYLMNTFSGHFKS